MFFRKKVGPVSWLVVFLGNPGAKYERTRHNAGFMVSHLIEKATGIKINRLKYKALTGVGSFGGDKVFFMKPQTYMNLSGDPVRAVMKFYNLPLERVIVLSDDVSLPVGKIRVRRSGTAGGHNGLKDIIAKCSGDGFPRIKIGVGSPTHPDFDMADWVLSVFSAKEIEQIGEALQRAVDAIEVIIRTDVDNAMNNYN